MVVAGVAMARVAMIRVWRGGVPFSAVAVGSVLPVMVMMVMMALAMGGLWFVPGHRLRSPLSVSVTGRSPRGKVKAGGFPGGADKGGQRITGSGAMA